MFNSKKGVSLITVLLFMLVATIAATATFKWLTSENRSSASRMLRQEAYQSAVAGIEDTRAWMSNHANDVGGIIKQYLENQKRPILLNSALPQLARASQNYNVWLAGVNAEKNTYKIKIISKGTSNRGTEHTEVAILKVDGLYRIKIPQNSERFTFNKAFHGASEGITGNDTIGSGNINGDWAYSNTPVVKGDMIVTGDTKYGGKVHHYGDFYLGGNLSSDGETIYGTEGIDTSVIYIGGNVSCPNGQPIRVYGDLYVKGNVSELCKIFVSKNFTTGGKIFRNNNYNIEIGLNWVFTNQYNSGDGGNEQLELTRYVNNNTNFSVGANLYMPYKIKAYCNTGDNHCGDYSGKRGFKVNGSIYRYNNDQFEIESQQDSYYGYGVYMEGYNRPFEGVGKDRCNNDDTKNCRQARIFSFNAAEVSNERIHEWSQTDNVLKNVGGNYWKHINRMNKYGQMISPTTGNIPEPIMLKNESAWKAAKANTFCGIGNRFYIDDSFIDKINMCYINAKAQGKLYNDEYLIIEWQYQEDKSVSKDLVGKFVFDVTTSLGNVNLPSTSSGSIVFLYLEKGANGQLKGRKDATYNYLVYSKDDINEINGIHFKGSVIMADGKKLTKYQGNNNLEFDSSVLKSLASAGIIKENPEYTKLVEGSEESETVISGSATLYDSYYISTSPQLIISLESQYASHEKIETSGAEAAQAISPSAVILPRVIYLTKNPEGRLIDYYDIVNLNGAHEQKDAAKVSCDPSLNTYGLLYQNGTMLSDDVYTCTHQGETGDIPFYVVVTGETGASPAIKFPDENVEITTSSEVTISAEIESSTHPTPASVDIAVSAHPSGWQVIPVSGTSLVKRETSDLEDVYTLTFTPNQSSIDLFTVTTTSTAEQGSVNIYLRSPMTGCIIKKYTSTQVIMTGYVSVERASIGQYCSKSENSQICSEQGYDQKVSALDCDDLVSGEWIRARGTNVKVMEQNNKWSVGTNTAISLKDMNNVPDYCELLLPTDNNTIQQAEQNGEYKLYASLKRKRYTLTVKTKGIESSGTSVSVLYNNGEDDYTDGTSSICKKNSDGDLVCSVYAGWHIKTTYTLDGSDEFSRWECTGDNCTDNSIKSYQYQLKTITSDNTITAIFNDKDKHCFYEDFTKLTAFCTGSATKCINTCEGGSSHSCSVSGVSADWQLMYPNNGNSTSIPPVIQNGFITVNSSLQNENPTIILSTKEAGIHGTMSTMIQTTILENKNKSMYSGFIFSSDASASSYTILNIYGDASNSKALTARVCKGSSQLNTVTSSNCTDVVFKKSSSQNLSIRSEDMIKLWIELSIENKLTITATVENSTATAELDISSYLGSRDEHSRYVGFSISNPSFKIYDIGWSSLYFADDCFENPKIICSFNANYLGGRVPKDKDVSPWVGLSSWFEDHNCTLTYYYNGCDNTTGNATYGCENNMFNRNWFISWWNEHDASGTFFGATLNGSTYNFSNEDIHGTSYTTPYGTTTAINDAKVKIECADQTSLNGTWTSCGSFWVGEIERCSQNAEIYNSDIPIYGNSDANQEIPVGESNSIVNLRGSILLIDISDFAETEGDKIVLYLKDKNGGISIPREITSNGTHSFDVNDMSNLDSFNPELVQTIILKSTYSSYHINSILSSCPYALNITNCKATYNGISWRITSTITNLEGAAINGCSVKEAHGAIEEMSELSCPENGVFSFNEDGLYNQVNSSGTAITRSFEVKAKSSDGGFVSCTTEPVTIAPIEITCSLSKAETTSGVEKLTLTYGFTGCPNSSCEYTVSAEDSDGITRASAIGNGTGETQTWSPTLSSGEYTYKVSVSGIEKNCGTEKIENDIQVSNCKITGTKVSADLSTTTNTEWEMQAVILDNIYNVVAETHVHKGHGKKYDHELPSTTTLVSGTYPVQLILNGKTVTTCGPMSITVNNASTSSSSTALSSSVTAPVESSSSKANEIKATCEFERDITTNEKTANFNVNFTSGMESGMYIYLQSTNFKSEDIWVYNNGNLTIPVSNTSNLAGTYTLYTKDKKTICSAKLNVVNSILHNCKASKQKVLAGSKITLSGTYSGKYCYNVHVEMNNQWIANGSCTTTGSLSEDIYASDNPGTNTYTLYVKGDNNKDYECSTEIETTGYTIKQLGGHNEWSDWNAVDVACNDSIYIKVDGYQNRNVYCRSYDKKGHITIRGNGIGTNSNASTCNSEGYCDDATLGLCLSGENPCERIIYTSCNESSIKCRVE